MTDKSVWFRINDPDRALLVYQENFASLASSALKLGKYEATIFYPGSKYRALAAAAKATKNKLIVENVMTHLDTSFVWLGGKVVLIRNLYRELGLMLESDQPQGLVTPDADLVQLWLNSKSVELFGLSFLEEGVDRKTASNWYQTDLPRKQQAIRDAGESPFEISARVLFTDDR